MNAICRKGEKVYGIEYQFYNNRCNKNSLFCCQNRNYNDVQRRRGCMEEMKKQIKDLVNQINNMYILMLTLDMLKNMTK